MDALVRYRWPGNVRELQNVIEHLVVLSDPDEIIDADRLSILSDEASNGGGGSESAQGFASSVNFRDAFHDAKQRLVDRFEREYLAQVVARTGGNMSEAARQAGIDRTTLYRLMEKHRLSKDAFSS
jgi:DNA-binding NtrC family response regulator